jgi:phosphoesterase RecJ-like protein
MSQEIISQKIHHHINQAKQPLFVMHKKPDGDTLGSALAMAQWFEREGKHALIFCKDVAPKHYDFIPSFNRIKNDPAIFSHDEVDLVVVLDSGDLTYAGVEEIVKNLDKDLPIINIDHHATNQHYGKFNLVDPEASSTAEVVYNFFSHNNVKIDKHIATALLVGILTDTTNFTNPGTTVSSMRVASELISHGARTNEISKNVLKNKSIDALRLWGRTLSRLEENKELNMAIAVIKKEDFTDIQSPSEAVEGVANFLNALLDVKLVLVLRETDDGYVKGSFRSTDIDVSQIAQALGGGGHKKAAGFTIKGKLDKVDGRWQIV